MDVTSLKDRLGRSRFVREFSRSAIATTVLLVVMFSLPSLGLQEPVRSLLGLATFVICAWHAGFGPALALAPLLMVLVRLVPDSDKTWNVPIEDIVEFLVLTLIASVAGLAGQYRRRYQSAQARHAQRLRDQARTLALANIVFTDMHGIITEWSSGAERLFGWTRSEAVGRRIHDLLPTSFPVELEEIEREVTYAGEWQGEVIHRRKDGAEVVVAAHWILYRDSKGVPIGIAEVHNDITELRRAEAMIREADRRKDEFLATLAHEIRNPLAPIRTGLELMKMIRDDPVLLEQTRSTMEGQTMQLITLVDDLLDVSRITRGKMELRRTNIDLCESVQAAVSAARPFIDEAGHEITIELPEGPLLVNGDPHRLTQIFTNLLINAAKYMPEGGHIELRAHRSPDEAKISIRDNGIGIAPDMRERIFEMFTQVDRPADKMRAGLGIGLTLAKSLVEMHQGRIEVESPGINQGSTFTVRLPLVELQTSNRPQVVGAIPALSRKVLIVDDNRPAAEMLSTVIEMMGHDVRMAVDGRQAIAIAQAFGPEIVLMDLGMPRMNGFEAAKRIWERPGLEETQIVALSGWGQEGDRQRTRQAGFAAHLVKPVEIEDLRRLFLELEESHSNNGLSAELDAELIAE